MFHGDVNRPFLMVTPLGQNDDKGTQEAVMESLLASELSFCTFRPTRMKTR